VAAILLAVRLLPSTTDNPLDVGANDKEFHIGLKPLPSGWHTDWITDSGSARRVSLTSPDGEVDIDILAYKGELDRDKFTQIGSLLFGSSFPAPYNKVDTIEYGAEIQRSSYKEVITDHRTIYTSIDVLWHEAMEDYAYIVVARSIQESNPNVELAREHLRFSPPRLTALGHVKKWCTDGGEFLESGETLFALLSWILVTGWGIWYLWKKLDKKWKPLKYIVGAGIVGLTVATRTILALSWLGTGVVIFLLVAVIGVATALLTGAWNFED
jgi:hypothetical protein